MSSNIIDLGQWTRAVEKAGPDGPCIVIQERDHEHDDWSDSVTLYTDEARRLATFIRDLDGMSLPGEL